MTEINSTGLGLASLQTESFTQPELFAGDTPAVVTDYGILGETLDDAGIPAWTPVFVDPSDRSITLAVAGSVDPEDDVAPNAVTTVDIAAGSASTSSVPVYKAGMFNVDALNWPASFSTDALKFTAFNMAQCQIYVKRPEYQ
jgi:hypothetical protein